MIFLLEKTAIKYTRNGVQRLNSTTGEKENLTVSEYGKQSRYQKDGATRINNLSQLRHDVASNKTTAKTSHTKTHANNPKPYPYKRNPQDKLGRHSAQSTPHSSSDMIDTVYSSRSNSQSSNSSNSAVDSIAFGVHSAKATFNNTRSAVKNAKAVHNHSSSREMRKSKAGIDAMGRKYRMEKAVGRFSKKIIDKGADAIANEIGKEDNPALQAFSGSYVFAKKSLNTAHGVSNMAKKANGKYKKYKYKRTNSRRVKNNAQRKAAQSTAKASTKFAQSAMTKAGTLIKVVVQKAAMALTKLLANPATLKFILIAGACIVVIMFLVTMISTMVTGAFGSTKAENADPRYSTLINKLDSDFKEDLLKQKSDMEGPLHVVQIIGLDLVNTNPDDMLALLAAYNDFDLDYSGSNVSQIEEWHKMLNTYWVETKTEEYTSPEGQPFTMTFTTFHINVFTVKEKINDFGLTPDQIELLLIILQVHEDMDNSGSGGDIPPPVDGDGSLIFPLTHDRYISSPYGERRHPITGAPDFHHAIDIPASKGTPIYSAADGVVTFAGKRGSYGNLVIIKHDDGKETRYAHCDTIKVSSGTKVKAGQNIATVGKTGDTTGNHLHFEVRINGKSVDPMLFF